MQKRTPSVALILGAAVTFSSCLITESSDHAPSAPDYSTARSPGEIPTINVLNATLRPDGDVGARVGFIGWYDGFMGEGDGVFSFYDCDHVNDCCGCPFNLYKAIDEPYEERNSLDELLYTSRGTSEFSVKFSDLTSASAVQVKEIQFRIGKFKVRQDQNEPNPETTVALEYFIQGVFKGSDVWTCLYHNPNCDLEIVEWSTVFPGLNYSLADINSLEVRVSVYNSPDGTCPTNGNWCEAWIYHLDAKIKYQNLGEGEI